ncbi:hypothetical protein [Armatimonas sp.]|uniref:hypothetical protein n=1 Tax=Armatimonas sp. TaxID=1872638 RepID=UPI00286C9B41|nr:hypothetical protein [Armatimonas sp.]
MKQVLFLSAAALALIALTGCGGGGGSDEPDITREQLTSDWRMSTIRGNANYEGGSADATCPVTLKQIKNPSLFVRCGSKDDIVIRDNGTATYLGVSATWSLSGSTITLDLGSTFGIVTVSVTPEPEVAGQPKRLRLRQLSRVVKGVRNTDEDGVEIVINDLST